jgi:hypothetical protein
MNQPVIAADGSAIFEANCGIVGLGPYDPEEGMPWPTEGYDAHLFKYNRYLPNGEYREEDHVFAISGHSREEWLALAEVMIERWNAWKEYIQAMPDDPSA